MVLSEISQRFEEFDRQVYWSSKRETYPAQQRGIADVPTEQTTMKGNFRTKKNGEGEIRTLDTVSRMQSFQDCALNHSATSPKSKQKRST